MAWHFIFSSLLFWWSLIYPFILCFCVQKSLLNPKSWKLFHVLFLEFYCFRFHIYFYNPFWVNFYMWCEAKVKAHYFAYGYSITVVPSVEITSLLNYLGTIAKNQLTIYVTIYFFGLCILFHWSLCVYLYANTTLPWWLQHYIVRLRIR